MALFGFICLFIFTIYVTVATFGAVWLELGFGGKISTYSIIWIVISGVMWYLTYVNFPFTVTMK